MKITIESDSDWMQEDIKDMLSSSLRDEVRKLCQKVVKAKEQELTAMALKDIKTIKTTPTKGKPRGKV